MPRKTICLSREPLFELIWSRPMTEAAKQTGLSDGGLAKICRRLSIPIPGRGYGAKKEAGRAPSRPPLPALGKNEQSEVLVTRHEPPPPEPAQQSESERLIAFENAPENRITVDPTRHLQHPLIARTEQSLRAAERDETGLVRPFDKAAWQEDIAAFTETRRTVGTPAAVERSRSGNGAHAWFFFSVSVPPPWRGGWAATSSPRPWPAATNSAWNPTTGSFQAKIRFHVAVSETLSRCHSSTSRETKGTRFSSTSDSRLVPISGLTSRQFNQIKRLAAFQNPEFDKRQSMRLSTALTPRIIACAEEFPGHIALPRGCEADLAQCLTDHGIELRTGDQRCAGQPIEVRFQGVLTRVQEEAARELLKHDIGVFVAPPGVGKTVLGTYLIARRAVSNTRAPPPVARPVGGAARHVPRA